MSGQSSGSIFHLTNHEIYVLTAADSQRVGGQVATWVMLTTLVPDHLRIVASISPFNYTYELIQSQQAFVIQMLAANQYDWVPRFGLQSGRTNDKFADISLTYTESGIPILPDTCGWAECKVIHQVDLGDRQLCIADVVNQAFFPDRQPLTKVDAFHQLPSEMFQALAEKRRVDGNRDRQYIKDVID